MEKITGNNSAFPVPGLNTERGFTKREYFAAMALQAMAGNDAPPDPIAELAVQYADALIKALNK